MNCENDQNRNAANRDIWSKINEAAPVKKESAPVVEDNGQLELFATQPEKKESSVDRRILHQLKELNLMGMTPMDVMNQIYKWQQKLK